MYQSPRANCFLFPNSKIKDQWQNGKCRTLYFPKRDQTYQIFLQMQEDLWSKSELLEWYDDSDNDFIHHGVGVSRR